MNPEKAEKLFKLMKQFGVEYFKHEDIEIKMSGVEVSKELPIKKEQAKTTKKTKAVPTQAIPPTESTIPHHVNEVAGLLKLNDFDLVDKLFPDYSQMTEQKVGK